MDEVAENSDALMERYLEGEEISHEEIVDALKEGTNHGALFPVTCGVATRNLGTNRLLDAIVEDLPSPVKHGGLEVGEVTLEPRRGRGALRLRLQDARRPVRRADQPLPRLPGRDRARQPGAQHARPRQGADRPAARRSRARRPSHVDEFGPGDIGAVAKLKETQAPATGWPRATSRSRCRAIKLPAPVMAFAVEPKSKGDEEKVFTALRRLQEEDPTIDLHRDPQTGEQIVAGLSQVHVEVIVERLKRPLRRRGRPQAAARALPGDDPQAGQGARPPQEADRRARPVRRLPHRDRAAAPTATGFEFVNAIKGGVIPDRLHPGGREGRARGDAATASSPAIRSRTCACGSTTAPTTRSTPPRWRSSWPARWR